jgi:hypothetical protein
MMKGMSKSETAFFVVCELYWDLLLTLLEAKGKSKKLYFESFRWIKGWITWCILDDDGTRGFGGGGGAMLNAQGPLLRRQELYALLIQFARRIVGKSNFSKPGKNLMCFTYSQRAHHERKSHAWCSLTLRALVYGASLETALHGNGLK